MTAPSFIFFHRLNDLTGKMMNIHHHICDPVLLQIFNITLQQGFAVGPLPVWASNTEQALACYEQSAQRQAFVDVLAGRTA